MVPTRRASRWSGRLLLPRYLASALAARTADEGARVSLVLLALQQTGSAAIGGGLIAALLVPHVVAAPLVGAVIDRSRRPRWVIAALVGGFAASLLSVAFLLGRVPLGLVVALLLVGGCCGPAITGGLTSRLPALVGEGATPRAFGLDSLFYNLAGIAGPALAGIAAAAVSPTAAQALLAASAAVGAVGVATLPLGAPQDRTSADRPTLLSGVREIATRPVLRTVNLSSTLGQVGPGALPVVAAVLALSLHRPAGGGLLLSTVAAGSLVGSLLWTWHPAAPHRAPLVTTLSMIGVGVPLAVAAATTSLALTTVLFGLSGLFVGPFASALFTARTDYSSEACRTQVFTIGAGLKVSAAALGAALVGLLTALPGWALLLLVSASPILAGVLGTLVLALSPPEARERPAPRTAASPAGCRPQ